MWRYLGSRATGSDCTIAAILELAYSTPGSDCTIAAILELTYVTPTTAPARSALALDIGFLDALCDALLLHEILSRTDLVHSWTRANVNGKIETTY
jgi:hypothetical protein